MPGPGVAAVHGGRSPLRGLRPTVLPW